MPITTRMTPDCQSRSNSATSVNPPYSTPETSSLSPPSSSSRIVSRSLVWREMMRPDVYDSWNSRLSRCVCRKIRLRRSSMTVCVEARRDDDVPADERRTAERGEQVHGDDDDRRHPVHLVDDRGQRRVDAVRDQRGAGDPQRRRDDEDDAGEHELPLQRA